jgi:hypothetical protein
MTNQYVAEAMTAYNSYTAFWPDCKKKKLVPADLKQLGKQVAGYLKNLARDAKREAAALPEGEWFKAIAVPKKKKENQQALLANWANIILKSKIKAPKADKNPSRLKGESGRAAKRQKIQDEVKGASAVTPSALSTSSVSKQRDGDVPQTSVPKQREENHFDEREVVSLIDNERAVAKARHDETMGVLRGVAETMKESTAAMVQGISQLTAVLTNSMHNNQSSMYDTPDSAPWAGRSGLHTAPRHRQSQTMRAGIPFRPSQHELLQYSGDDSQGTFR